MNRIFNFQLSIFKNFKSNSNKGFTLLELLIVMTVIGGLAAIVLVGFPGTRKRARDTQRKSDLKQYQTLIELYANREGKYLDTGGTVNMTSKCSALGASACPEDPESSQRYKLNSSSTQYVMWAELELPKQSSGNANYFILCSNGVAKEKVKTGDPTFGADCN